MPIRMTLTGGAHHQSMMDSNIYTTGSLTSFVDPGLFHRNTMDSPGSSNLANPVPNQKHKVLCQAIGHGIAQARG